MKTSDLKTISIVLPVFNEAAGIEHFNLELSNELDKIKSYNFEIIYCDDGSSDDSLNILSRLANIDDRIRIISLSKNFGKEIATTAGIELAIGTAIITLDSDSQHPVELIPKFIDLWQSGSRVVIGVRQSSSYGSIFKRFSSYVFYSLFNRFTSTELIPGATDFRLIDRVVQTEFKKLTERNRITRGLIDWLGYSRSYIEFEAKERKGGSASYSYKKLAKLALDSVISMSNSPLYAVAYSGAVILPLSLVLGLVMLVDKFLGDPLNWQAKGVAYLSVLILFLIGVLLTSQGLIGLYLSRIHEETQNRPLYIIDKDRSTRV